MKTIIQIPERIKRSSNSASEVLRRVVKIELRKTDAREEERSRGKSKHELSQELERLGI